MFVTEKEIVRIQLDPFRETADTETSNNQWPPKLETSRFKLFKDKKSKNPMQKAEAEKAKKTKQDKSESERDGEDNE
jgi:hypothetical protein